MNDNSYKKYNSCITVKTCSKPDNANATITPSDSTIDVGASYTITCANNYVQSGGTNMTCTDTNVFDKTPSCTG